MPWENLGSCSQAEQSSILPDLLGSPLGEKLHGNGPVPSHSNHVGLFLLTTLVLSWQKPSQSHRGQSRDG